VGKILGTDENTGAGGANVWTHALLRQVFAKGRSRGASRGPALRALPKEAGLRVALRRSLRVGKNAGIEVEELGIVPDEVHRMTREDLLRGNRDLIDHAACILAAMPVYALRTDMRERGSEVIVEVATRNIDRLDVSIGGRPFASQELRRQVARARIVMPAHVRDVVELCGFIKGKLVARRRI